MSGPNDSSDSASVGWRREVIHEVRNHFGLAGDGQFALVRKESGEPLEPVGRTLASFELKDGEELVLTGGGLQVEWTV